MRPIQEIIEALEIVSSTLSEVTSAEVLERKELSTVEGKLQDLYHEVELSTLSRKEKLSLVNAIGEERQKRRRIKNTLELIEPCSKLVADHSKTVTLLGNLANKLKTTVALQDSRVYSPRSEQATNLKISKQKIHKQYR